MGRAFFLVAASTAAAFVLGAAPAAHEIPRTVAVNLFVKADGPRIHVLIRVPLSAMRDIEFPQRDGFLDVARSEPALREAVAQWILPDLELFEDGRALPPPVIVRARASLPSDRSFASFEDARAHLAGRPLAETVRLPWDQALLDAWLEYPGRPEAGGPGAAVSVRPAFERLGVDVVTAIRFIDGGTTRAFELRGDPGIVRLDPHWHQAAARFVALGVVHILDGVDHLLFLVCLVIPLRRLRPLVLVVTSFTAAHSVTLIGSALGAAPDALWFPPLVEVLIAASIVYMAIENVVATPSIRRRCAMAFGFGLIHGFGFSFALRETLQFAGAHLLVSLLSFNAGVELGQLLVLAALAPALGLLFRRAVAERPGTIVLSVLVGHTAWHWMTARWETLRAYDAPALDGPSLLAAVRTMLVLGVAVALVWAARWRLARREVPAGRLEVPRP